MYARFRTPLTRFSHAIEGLARGLRVLPRLSSLRLGGEHVERLPFEALPGHHREAASGMLAELTQLGFDDPAVLRLSTGDPATHGELALEIRSKQEPVQALLRFHTHPDLLGRTHCSLLTELEGGGVLLTLQHEEPEPCPPTHDDTVCLDPDSTPLLLLQRHRKRLATCGTTARKQNAESTGGFAHVFQQRWGTALGEAGLCGWLKETGDGRWRLRPSALLGRAWLLARKELENEKRQRGFGHPQTPPPISSEARIEFDLEAFRRVRSSFLAAPQVQALPAKLLLFLLFAQVFDWTPDLHGLGLLLLVVLLHLGLPCAAAWLRRRQKRQATPATAWPDLENLLLGPIPGLLFATAGLAWTEAPEPGLHRFFLLALGFNLPALLPFMPLEGGQLLQRSPARRHPLLPALLQALSLVGLLLLAFIHPKGISLLLALPVLLYRIPAGRRERGLLDQVETELNGKTDPDKAQRALLQALRRASWAGLSWSARLRQAPRLLGELLQPACMRRESLRALVLLSSPLWLGLGSYLLLGNLQAHRELAEARRLAERSGLSPERLLHAPAVSPASNGALLLAGLRPGLEHLCGTGKLEGLLLRPPAPGLLSISNQIIDTYHGMTQATGFRMASVGRPSPFSEVEPLLGSLPGTLLPAEARHRLSAGDPDGAARLALDMLALSSLFQKDPAWWSWLADRELQEKGLRLLEASLAEGATLSDAEHARLIALLDESSYLDYSIRTLARSGYAAILAGRDPLTGTSWSSQAENDRFVPGLLELLARTAPSSTREQTSRVLETVDNQERMLRLNEDGFAILLKADDGLPGTGGQLKQFMELIALRRQALAAVLISRQTLWSSWAPTNFKEIIALGWTGTPSHPATGSSLAWQKTTDGESLVYPNAEGDAATLTWRLPPRRIRMPRPLSGQNGPLWRP